MFFAQPYKDQFYFFMCQVTKKMMMQGYIEVSREKKKEKK